MAAPTAGAELLYHDRPHVGQEAPLLSPPLAASFVPSAGQKR
jgi:hypothetical protein